MLGNDTIQEGIVTRLKAISAITTLVGDEIRETEWQGTEFAYPGIRVDIEQIPSIEGCDYGEIDFFVRVFTEDASSKNCSNIAGVVFLNLPRAFTSNGVLFTGVYCRRMGRPLRIGKRTWQSNMEYRGIVSG